ncbi:MAG: 50S ribosomal protein L35ae, partial [DPANN group archaeon]|nr:50S ribosomal protein L35ae [DPANN group archaeon]
VKVEGIDKKADVHKIVGKKVIWTSPSGKKIEGKITQAHGTKGAARVHFTEKGLPGQAIGAKVDIEYVLLLSLVAKACDFLRGKYLMV